MQTSIHPKYHNDTKVTCACGNSFTTGSTLPEIKVEICSACHPFFTGEMRFVDVQGRVEKFQAKQKAATSYTKKGKKRTSTDTPQPTKTLKEMLSGN
ncbi:50S ribosomal protein L31 [Candidatus Nomurabacteria bacterium CG10_big_fil_rev_8_21_14_0_10_35_16]|uniref:Large ribosomal subunit protein bL31 n=1 Tax=Candidatus Nomurabacteria bacterium CG10_big_fil_rev_8_21_14_0_10_35_16 TaxID=1974731 RepID=A0A2H0TDU7_9BACT|nr:MAG: 50S ribosomal protein L31 [Candidatus Nomurabacteria bacterium CG10_big_fil_rev_8_21_14_0_10_35_16]